MTSLGACPPWAVLESMIDGADSDRNGKVSISISSIKTYLRPIRRTSNTVVFSIINFFCKD